MKICGRDITEPMFRALSKLLEKGMIGPNALDRRTAGALVERGLVESFIPEATTYAMAVRGRIRCYRLTATGEEEIRKLRQRRDRAQEMRGLAR